MGDLTEEPSDKLPNHQDHRNVQTHDSVRKVVTLIQSIIETEFIIVQYMSQPLCGGVCIFYDMFTCILDPYPYPARKPKLGGLTLSLNMIIGNTRQLPAEGLHSSMAMSHHSWCPLRFNDLSLIRDSVTCWYPSSFPGEERIESVNSTTANE